MAKKKVTKKKSTSHKRSTESTEHTLIKNSAEMQRIMIKLIERFDKLSNKISELLELFEDSAKILIKKEIESGKTKDMTPEILEKINQIMDQNKIIAKGLTLVHENKAQEFEIPKPQRTSEIISSQKKVRFMPKPQAKTHKEIEPVFEMPEE